MKWVQVLAALCFIKSGHCEYSDLFSFSSLMNSVSHRFGYEVCDEKYMTPDFKQLESDLQTLLFGQDIIIEKLVPILESHFSVQPRKALVISMHGWTGSGKNHATKIVLNSIFKRAESKFVQMFNGLLHFPIDEKKYVDQYKINLQNWIRGNVSECPRSVFVFDEVDKMPPGIVDSIKPFMDYHEKINSVDYRKAIFIFISNVGAEVINLQYKNLWMKGKSRSDMKYKDFEPLLRSALYSSSGAFRESSILEGHLVSLYLPFLPLQEEEVTKCIVKELDFQGISKNQYNINMIFNELEFNSDSISTSGCKRISDIVASFKYRLRHQEL